MAHPGIATNNRKVVFDRSMFLDGFIRASNASSDARCPVFAWPLLKLMAGVLIGFSRPDEP
jgi:hypothetical protein